MVSATKKPVDTSRFIHNTVHTAFGDQYYHIYNARLKQARPALLERAKFRWGNDIRNVPLEELNDSLGSEEVFVIGTLFKLMPNQPSILRELEENEPTPADPSANFTSDEDTLILHEIDENVKVVGDIDPHEHVTGIPVALMGHQQNDGGKFEVSDVCYSGPMLSVFQSKNTNGKEFKDGDSYPKLLLVSGLEIGISETMEKEEAQAYLLAIKRFKDIILDDKNVQKVIIAGNSCCSNSRDRKKILEILDNFLLHIAQGQASIEVMPGRNDPTSLLLPQQPFHPKILPKSGMLENIHPNTNPSLTEVNGLLALGTSGEIIDIIKQHCRIEYSTTILRNTLEWGHMAPSAPDNLSCMPFKESDPFLIDFVPDVYFAGNQKEYTVTTYSTDTKPKIQIISIPKFHKSLSYVEVNLLNLDVQEKLLSMD